MSARRRTSSTKQYIYSERYLKKLIPKRMVRSNFILESSSTLKFNNGWTLSHCRPAGPRSEVQGPGVFIVNSNWTVICYSKWKKNWFVVERLDGIRREFVAGDNFSFLTPSLLRLVLFSPSDPPTNLFSNYFPWPTLAVRGIHLSRLNR